MSVHPSTHRSIAKMALLGGAAAGMLVLGTVAPAMAAGGSDGNTSDGGTTQANVAVDTSLSLTGLTSSFLLTGIPGDTVSQDGAVQLTVTTNNNAGYGVTVQSESDAMNPAVSTGDSIPIGNLSVRETGKPGFTPVSNLGTVSVHTQGSRSAALGDSISNDYQVVIPFVNSATYSATLDYVATAS